jgi:hypothetical protein
MVGRLTGHSIWFAFSDWTSFTTWTAIWLIFEVPALD